MSSRRTLLGGVLAIAVASGGIGWYAGQQIQSPADIAAETAAPEPSLITVPVEQLLLSRNVVVRGQAGFDDITEISTSATAGGSSIITKLTKQRGDTLSEGDVVIEVAGRPVIVLQGELPVFRPLTPSLEGPDVVQLQEALARLGHYSGSIDGIYGPATGAAVSALYESVGYSAIEPSRQELEQLEAAQDAVNDAARELTAARNTGSGLPASERLRLEQEIRNAGVRLVFVETDAARIEQEAWDVVAEAMYVLAQAQGTNDQGAIAQALNDLIEAQAQETRVKLEQGNLVEQATTEVAIAKAALKESVAAAVESGANERVSDARDQLSDAQENLSRVQAEIGIQLPDSELVFLPSLPRQVQTLDVVAGEFPQGPVMSVTGAGVAVRGSVSAPERRLVNKGMAVTLEDTALGISVAGIIAFVADNPGGPNLSNDRYAVRFEPLDQLPEDLLNRNLKVTIPVTTTGGVVYAVPFAAVSAGVDGTERVEIAQSDGSVVTVEVNRGLADPSQGLVEVTPVQAGAISPGDRVVVGRDLNLSRTTAGGDPAESQDGADG